MASSGEPVNYDAIELPDPSETPYPEWDTDERRASLLRAVIRAGGPLRLNKAALARRFGVHRATVTREDMDAVSESVAHHVGDADQLLTTVRAAFERCYGDLLG